MGSAYFRPRNMIMQGKDELAVSTVSCSPNLLCSELLQQGMFQFGE